MNTNVSVMTATLFVFIPLVIISLQVQVGAIEDASNFSQSITGSGMHAKTAGIHLLTGHEGIGGTYTSSEFQDYFSDCGEDIPSVSENDLRVQTRNNGCQLEDHSRHGVIRVGVQVIRNGEVHNEKVLVAY
jgi:hypothetical protein